MGEDIDVNIEDESGYTPLGRAAQKQEWEKALVLLSDPRTDRIQCWKHEWPYKAPPVRVQLVERMLRIYAGPWYEDDRNRKYFRDAVGRCLDHPNTDPNSTDVTYGGGTVLHVL